MPINTTRYDLTQALADVRGAPLSYAERTCVDLSASPHQMVGVLDESLKRLRHDPSAAKYVAALERARAYFHAEAVEIARDFIQTQMF